MKFETLENGIRLATDHMSSVKTATVSICVANSGSRFENQKILSKEISGISHFLEHMAFKGTSKSTAEKIAQRADYYGIQMNAYTSHEQTVYYAKSLEEFLPHAIELLVEIVTDSTFPAKEIESEKGVILQEIARTEDDPSSIIFDNFNSCAYPSSLLGKSILGTPEFVQSVTQEDLFGYIKSRYGRNNIIVSVAGSFNEQQTKELVQNSFANMTAKSDNAMESAGYRGGISAQEKDLQQVNFMLGFEGLQNGDDDYYNLALASIILGGGMSSRLFQEVREKRGLAYSIYSFNMGYIDSGLFVMNTGTDAQSANECIDIMCEQLQDIQHNISEEELLSAKNQIKARIAMSLESTNYRADKNATNLARYGQIIHPEDVIAKVNEATQNDVKNAVSKMLQSSKPTVASIGPIAELYNYDQILQKFSS